MNTLKDTIVNIRQLGIEIIKCPRCDGTGKPYSWWRSIWCTGKCIICDGKGEVWRKMTNGGATTFATEKNEKEWEMIYDFADRVIDDYKPHPAQERFFKSKRVWHFSGDWSGAPVEAEWSRVPNKLEKHNARD